MSDPLTASDFWPLILKLPHDERVLLAKLALRAAAQGDSSAAAYAAAPPALPDKRRPVRLLSRDAMLPSLNEVIVVPATRTIRGIDTEVILTEDDGMPTACALNFDHVSLARSEGANRCNDCPIGRRSLARGRARSARRLRLRAQRIASRVRVT